MVRRVKARSEASALAVALALTRPSATLSQGERVYLLALTRPSATLRVAGGGDLLAE
jgi:hypothetical protein